MELKFSGSKFELQNLPTYAHNQITRAMPGNRGQLLRFAL